MNLFTEALYEQNTIGSLLFIQKIRLHMTDTNKK